MLTFARECCHVTGGYRLLVEQKNAWYMDARLRDFLWV